MLYQGRKGLFTTLRGGGIDAKKREETIRDTYTILPNNAYTHITLLQFKLNV